MIDSSEMPLELSIVMPCLNEAETIEGCVKRSVETLRREGIAGEVLVADNGSDDGSRELAASAGARVVPVTARGYGAALIGGCTAARGRFILMADADGSYDFSQAPEFLRKLREGNDLVMGNRFRGQIKPGAMPWKNRYIGNPVLTTIGRLFFRTPVSDFHCGLRAFSKDAFEKLELCTTGMEFASEMVIKATLLKLRVAEIPTTLSPDGRSRRPHLRPWRDGWRHLRFMLLYSPRWLFLYPGILLMLAGLALTLWLLPRPQQIGHIVVDVHTMFVAMILAVVGFQAVCFGVTTKIYAVTHGLHPTNSFPMRIFRYFTLEVGLTVGVVCLLLGSSGLAYSVLAWGQQQFGPLEPSRMLRTIIPSAFLVIVGMQTICTSFVLSIMGMSRK